MRQKNTETKSEYTELHNPVVVDEGLTISYGYVSKEQEPEMSVREMSLLADKKMYEAKSEYYRRTGMDRRTG